MTVKEYVESIVSMNLVIKVSGQLEYFITNDNIKLDDDITHAYLSTYSQHKHFVEVEIMNKYDENYNSKKIVINIDPETYKPIFDDNNSDEINLNIKKILEMSYDFDTYYGSFDNKKIFVKIIVE